MVKLVGPSSSSGQTPEIPEEKKIKKQKSTQYQTAIKRLGLEQQESKYFERTESKKNIRERISKPPQGGVALPIRPHRQEESKPPSSLEPQRPRGRTAPSSSRSRTIPSPSESLQVPPRPARKTSAPPRAVKDEIETPPLQTPAETETSKTKEPLIPTSSSRMKTSEPQQPTIVQVFGESEDSEGLSEEEVLPSPSQTQRPPRFMTVSEDQARQIVHDPNKVRALAASPEGRRELFRRGERLLKSTVVGFGEAQQVLHTVIGAGTRGLHESLSGGAKITDEQLKEEMALLQASIRRFQQIEHRDAIRYASETRFEHNGVDGEQIDHALARYNEIRANPVIQASIEKMEERSAIHQKISNLTGGDPQAWVNAHIPAGNDRRHAQRFLQGLQGSGTLHNSDAKPLRDALEREGLINRDEKTALGHRISDARHSLTGYQANDITLRKEIFSLVNQVNEMLLGERVFSTSLKAFLEPIYTPKDEKGKKMKDEQGHVIKLNYFQALEMKGIINAEQATYFQRHLHGVIENSEKLFSHIGTIQRADPEAEAGSPASFDAANLTQVLAALADETTPDSLYGLTQSMSKISERLPEFLKMIRDLQADPAKDDLSKQFKAAERRLLPGKSPVGADNLYIAPTQRAMRYPMYFGEIEKSTGRLGLTETLAFAQERIECLRKCSLWANYKV